MPEKIGLSDPILLVGCGKMGGALLAGWLDQGVPTDQILVVEPAIDAERSRIPGGISVLKDAADIADDFEPAVVIFAVKPQVMGEVVPLYDRFTAAGTVFMSIAAGTPIRFFEDNLGVGAGVGRVMPNTPALVGAGVSALFANNRVTEAQCGLAENIMLAVGTTVWVKDESLMDIITAVSGSGPAYFFYLMEALEQAGIDGGLKPDIARLLTLETALGAARLALEADDPPLELRRRVTSPGGTTEAAICVLDEEGTAGTIKRAINAARERSSELAKTLRNN